MPAIWKELRPTLTNFAARAGRRERRRGAACGRYTIEAACRRRRKEDDVVLVPSATLAERRVRDIDRQPSCYRNLFQLATGKECDELPVGRPERIARAFGPRERPRVERGDRAQPQAARALSRTD